MRIQNTDNFRNKQCRVWFKNGNFVEGKIIYIPNHSEKYNWHKVGWFINKPGFEDIEIKFKEVSDIEVRED